jgi:hypothetical protein
MAEWRKSRTHREWELAIGEVAVECMKWPMSRREAWLLAMLTGIVDDLGVAVGKTP